MPPGLSRTQLPDRPLRGPDGPQCEPFEGVASMSPGLEVLKRLHDDNDDYDEDEEDDDDAAADDDDEEDDHEDEDEEEEEE